MQKGKHAEGKTMQKGKLCRRETQTERKTMQNGKLCIKRKLCRRAYHAKGKITSEKTSLAYLAMFQEE